MSRTTIRIWYLIHKWSSLIPTAFLLMLCVSGLPLIFHDEIDAAMGFDTEKSLSGVASSEGGLPLDTMLDRALAVRPGEVPLFMAFSQDSPLLTVTTGPAPDAASGDMHLQFLDRVTGEALGPAPVNPLLDFLLQLHTDMFLGLPGMLFLGMMGISFIVALISGTVLYAPFMRRLRFGTLRTRRSLRVKRLDRHNFLGIVTLVWALVVGATGAINAFADPLTDAWRNGEIAEMTAAYASSQPLAPADYGSIDKAMAAAQDALPGRNPQFIGFPGGSWSSGHHYAIFFQGDRPVTEHLLTPALVDAATGELTDARTMPGINQALMMSKPLHFGDYGGLPLKILWALLTLATIWVLWTGIFLWLRRRGGEIDRRVDEIALGARKEMRA
ncbi:PepSY domain-containing protein [Qipengyuania citrea]|uniref:PepSY domain-containing protein n=1 Tax=Qipengyuania citrea TaxID=225971 RepID=A0ABY4U2P3_9SPHN|nr:PepSY-associated TM helix domain-containing protein [Qipengyuania citrea]USA60381.1 PepSY domain-containing protein [Qipengyuania citrea]